MVEVQASLIVLAVSLLVGGLAIAIGATLALKSRDYSHAVLTALLGAVAWAIVDAIFAELELVGALSSLVGLLVWVWVIRWRYDVGWVRGGFIGLFAWIAALVVLSLLALLGVNSLEAYGVPGA